MQKKHAEHQIRDPKRLRAMSHPLRLKLMSLLAEERSATATRCAEVLDESVASCSYHLNILAKYGFIEEAPGGQGREKPWRATTEEITVSPEGLEPEGRLAAGAAIDAWMDHEFAQLKDRLHSYELEPEPWREAIGTNATNTFLTAQEAAKVREEIEAIYDRYRDRQDQPGLRPADARPVRMFMSLTVAPPREEI
ncbi:MAG TPA: helix-turn-helix domain-containing protein [Pseudonocardiaceae bacterium]|jgi:DNA-binding transcriptional ArsR family regulator|nr:helix-turn-helix domain-containing protein [Pseudonocardiaceae bacterium]